MNLTNEQKIKLYTNLIRVRKLDEFLVQAFYDKKINRFHSQQGQEAVGVGAATFLRRDDYVFYSHRGHGISELVAKGISFKDIIAEHYGKATGGAGGIGFMNQCNLELGIFGRGGTVGGDLTIGAGVALAANMRGRGQIVAHFLGDGTTGRGTLHEAMLMSANWKLPILWLCSNNGSAIWVPVEVSFPKENIADLAFGYGMPSAVVDGQDVTAVYEAVQEATESARSGLGPSFIEFKTYRFRAPIEGFPDYCLDGLRSEAEILAWKKRDPVILYREKLFEEKILTENDFIRIDCEALKEVEEAKKFAEESPPPTPDILANAIYAD
ncbi:thiamine pyrophosphate-dependent dehydrogenase E1 component subunit alpha [Chloroflexota bacterium]